MRIRIAELISGTEQPVGEGVTAPCRAILKLDGQLLNGIVKSISIEQITAECLCATLLRGWGLPVPEPVIVDGSPIKFASVELKFPNLKHALGYTNNMHPEEVEVLLKYCKELLSRAPQTPDLIACDEAIGNFDRNLGNILWDGKDMYFIDHERALGLGDSPDANKIAALVIDSQNLTEIKQSAVAKALTLNCDLMKSIDCNKIDVNIFADYLNNRIRLVASKVIARFPKPADLLSNLPS